jgi:hypothetical protein
MHKNITQNIDKCFNDKHGIVCCMKNEFCIGIVTISCSREREEKITLTQLKIYERAKTFRCREIFSRRDGEKGVKYL